LADHPAALDVGDLEADAGVDILGIQGGWVTAAIVGASPAWRG
jgi:hypothetical protein